MKHYSLSIAIILLSLFGQSVEAQAQMRTLNHGKNTIVSVRFMPDGKRLVSASFDGTVVLWDVQTGKSIWRVHLDGVRGKDEYTVSDLLAMELSPDGCTIAVSYDRGHVVNNRLQKGEEYRIGLVDVKDGQERKVLAGSTARSLRLAFSPDGRTLASGGPDGTTRLWDVSTAQQTRAIESPRGISALAFSPDGKLLVIGQAAPNSMQVASAPDTILYNVESGEKVRSFRGQDGYVNDAAFSASGGMLAILRQAPYEITLMKTGTWELARSLKSPEVNADRISFSSDGRWLASGEAGNEGGRIFVWETATNVKPRSHALRSGVEAISFSPDGTTLAAGTEDGKVILLRP
jgi:WD40 repeat protein